MSYMPSPVEFSVVSVALINKDEKKRKRREERKEERGKYENNL